MSIIAVIGAALRLVLEIFTTWRATNQERKEERRKLEKQAKHAIATRNAADINRAFNKLRNL